MTRARPEQLLVARPVPPRSSRCGAVRIVAIVVAPLFLGALLNADGVQHTAETQPAGWRRDVAMALAAPLVQSSHALGLNRPRAWLDVLLHPVDPDATSSPMPSPSHRPPPSSTPSFEPTPTPTPVPTVDPPSPEPTVPPPTGWVATADDPAVLWVAGDSLTESFGPALVNVALGTGVMRATNQVKYSGGLTRPDFYDWPAALRRHLAESPADIVVFMVGANDAQAIRLPSGDWATFGTQAWIEEYRSRVAEAAAILAEHPTSAYWVGQPIARSSDFRARMALLNDLYRESAATHPTVRYVSSWEFFSTPGGAYSDYLPDNDGRPQLVRQRDGIHLTPPGGAWLAEHVFGVMAEDWRVRTD